MEHNQGEGQIVSTPYHVAIHARVPVLPDDLDFAGWNGR